jgi:hypothetical protein
VLVDGIITLLLGLMIYLQWPSSSVWAIGILVGVNLIVSPAIKYDHRSPRNNTERTPYFRFVCALALLPIAGYLRTT